MMGVRKYLTLLPAAALPAAPSDAQRPYARPDDTWINVDDDFAEVASIEVGRVYADDIQTCFCSSAVDEEALFVTATPIVVGETTLQGTVTSTSDDGFTLAAGGSAITVEVEELGRRSVTRFHPREGRPFRG